MQFNTKQDVIQFVESLNENQLTRGILALNKQGQSCIDGHLNRAMSGEDTYSEEYYKMIEMLGIDSISLSRVNNRAPEGKRKAAILKYLCNL